MSFQDKVNKSKEARNSLIPVMKEETVQKDTLKVNILLKEEDKKKKGTAKTFYLQKETADEFDKLAKKMKKSSSKLLQEILDGVISQNR